ncbi:uncharacterized protein LOC126991632 isoform X3 [Eriocheir sinensis]|nr:uncharacterized protein LOC126991632 isoform X3 [Eriocheir sinensis]XP_050706297.1 uncharacterized protein LOC126991632 isoform X3 [Eriocheir sinensis]XP_050706298.1 uncharacterized protein LOC126991632 isoform X3 [Eriocheir sinensis]XP_050706299.1 uncharacterized protein LOC126991632 isoform X3 [Eriocheir sinensis]XP_050706300.1 uncharacterized protein LOC126991632 isoform X3 [Eriocheir sinensis]XP_050706301.1 uncharacterized protein LOC126991632 isoform X3 [Eriocheir sinensis]XP_05070630
MSPRFRHPPKSLEELSLHAVFASVVADLNLAHLMTSDLRHSTLLAPLRLSSPEALRGVVAERLMRLPGILNDQIRRRLIELLFASVEPDRWANARLDVLKVLVDESVTSLDCRQQALPRQVLEVVASTCPNLTCLKVIIEQDNPVSGGGEWEPEGGGQGQGQPPDPDTPSPSSLPSPRTVGKRTAAPPTLHTHSPHTQHNPQHALTSPPAHQCLASLTRLTTLHLTNGATNEVLAALGECVHGLRELRVCYSFAVTDAGLTALCLRGASVPWPWVARRLYWLDLPPEHFNPCCSRLVEVDILGTKVSHFGLAFLLRHLPALRSLGPSPLVAPAIELLVSWRPAEFGAFTTHLRKVRDDDVSGPRLLTVALHCPDLRDLSLTHTFQEADLTSRHSVVMAHVTNLRHLKHLSLVNITAQSVAEMVNAVGSQLTALTVSCRHLDVALIFGTCTALRHLALEGEDCLAPVLAVEGFRHTALTKLQVVRIKCVLPAAYTDIIFTNARALSELEIVFLREMRDSHVSRLIRNKSLQRVREFTVRLAPKLTIDSARVLVKGCPRLAHLKDLGGWDVTAEEYKNFLRETKKENYDVSVAYTSRRAASGEHEPSGRTIWDLELDPLHRLDRQALRHSLGNLLPLVVL